VASNSFLASAEAPRARDGDAFQRLRLPVHEGLQVVDGWLHRARQDVEAGEREHGTGEAGSHRSGLLELGLRLLDVRRLEACHHELIVYRGAATPCLSTFYMPWIASVGSSRLDG